MSRRSVWSVVQPESSTWLLPVSLLPLLLLLLSFAALAAALPTPQESGPYESSGSLPFLQFTRGGIRVNFGGYHAQAGLGGLLTGSAADGGLHASAGTPSGAHASAGLGGTINGAPAGGLHARAGLGNGGPEAQAGLAGTAGGPRPQGILYAESSKGSAQPISPELEESNNIERTRSRVKHVQIIPRAKKAAVEQESSAAISSAAIANSVSSANDGGEEAERIKHPARWYFRKRLHERVGSAPSKPSYNAIVGPVPDSQIPPEAGASRPSPPPAQHPERGPPAVPSPPPSLTKRQHQQQQQQQQHQQQQQQQQHGSFTRAASQVDVVRPTGPTQHYKSSSLFDDIFNIPISALNAVNRLLKNHVGR